MPILSKKQTKILELCRAGVKFREMKEHGFSRSTAHDAYKRAQRNLERIIDTIDLAVDRKLLSRTQAGRLRRTLRKL